MTKRTTVFAVLVSSVVTLLLLVLARSKLSDWGFVVFIVAFVLLLSILEPFALNWKGNTGDGIELANR